MRVVRRRRAVDGIAAGVRGHRHHAHAVGQASVDGLQVLVVERLVSSTAAMASIDLRVGDRAVAASCAAMRDLVSSVVLAAEAHDEVRDRLAESCVLFWIALP